MEKAIAKPSKTAYNGGSDKEVRRLTELRIPGNAARVMRRLREAGWEASAVGGCVRDSLLGRAPKDWDICTNARPEEMRRVFEGWHTVDTGLKHGTLTVVLDHEPFEVTTYRTDGVYTDHRHPDAVSFVSELREDLSRRDFTVNAMAWNPEDGLIDLFGGQEDLRRQVIRCVGDPMARFEEDALRMLRGLRFASVYRFAIEEETARAIHAKHRDLGRVAAERIRVELSKLLCGAGAEDILRAYPDVITFLLPELAPCVGFDQRTPYHRWDVWEHTIRTVGAAAPTETLRLTMLLHDSGKPRVFTVDEQGIGHAYGHAKVSVQLAEAVCERLRLDTATRDRVLLLIAHHDAPIQPGEQALTRLLNRFGEEALRQLIEVHRADEAGKGVRPPEEADQWAAELLGALDSLLQKQPCFSLRSLAVNGRDLMALGIPKGPRIGEVLQALLERVMAGETGNQREQLLDAARQLAHLP